MADGLMVTHVRVEVIVWVLEPPAPDTWRCGAYTTGYGRRARKGLCIYYMHYLVNNAMNGRRCGALMFQVQDPAGT